MFDIFWLIIFCGDQNISWKKTLQKGLGPFRPMWYTLKDFHPTWDMFHICLLLLNVTTKVLFHLQKISNIIQNLNILKYNLILYMKSLIGK
jgi:hypothetical protein